MRKGLILLGMVLLLGLVLTGCSGLLSDDDTTTDGTGELALSIADNAVNDVAEVNVTLDKVEVHSEENGWQTIQDFSDEENGKKTFNLLDIRFDPELLGQEMLPVGNYTQIRLILAADENKKGFDGGVGESYVSFKKDGKEDMNLFVPSGAQSGLKIHHNFTIEEGTITELVLDNDVRTILNDNAFGNKGYILRPTAIEVIDRIVSGDVEGQVVNGEQEAITDYDVTVQAIAEEAVGDRIEEGDIVAETVATNEQKTYEDENGDEVVKPAGSFRLRGLHKDGSYTIKAYIEREGEKIYAVEDEYFENITVEAREVKELENELIIEPYQLDSIEVNGVQSIEIPGIGEESVEEDYSAVAKDQFGTEIEEEVSWSLNEEVDGVAIDSDNGTVTVSEDATPESFTVIATSTSNTDISGSLEVSLIEATSEVTTVEASGTDTILVPESDADPVTAPYTAEVKDQYGHEMADEGVNWSVEDVDGTDVNDGYVSIDSNDGVVTVTGEATAQTDSFKVIATSETNTDISKELEVSLEDVQSGTAVDLGTADSYVLLSPAGITNDNDFTSSINGDIGVSPADSSTINGFSLTMDSSGEFATSDQVNGNVYAADYAAPTPSELTAAVEDKDTAYTDAAARAADYTDEYAGDIGGQTLNPGVYKVNSSLSISDDVTLDGGENDIWIFQISGAMTQVSDTSINLENGAQAQNIFWQVADTVSIESGAHFEGIVLGWNDITLDTGASANGRLLALNENITLIENTIAETQ